MKKELVFHLKKQAYETSVTDIIRSMCRHDTPYNRRKLDAFRLEWIHDKDYEPHDREQWERFAQDRNVKIYLD